MRHDHFSEPRTPDRIRHHYLVERELADRLREAPRKRRLELYGVLYDELFQRVPDMPQLSKRSDRDERARQIDRQLLYLTRYLGPESHLLEIGAGDCELSIAAAVRSGRITALDVSTEVTPEQLPANVELVLSDGVSVAVAPGSVDVAFSNQLMEHLHPDDARAQLRNIYAALRPGGTYICITPNRITGPHDVSKHFDRTATGLHLKEYTNRELARLMREAGFASVSSIVPRSNGARLLPLLGIEAAESAIGLLPYKLRRRMPGALARSVNIRLAARK